MIGAGLGRTGTMSLMLALEELLAGPEPEEIDVELEYRTPSQAGSKRVLREGERRWIVDTGGELHASILLRNGLNG